MENINRAIVDGAHVVARVVEYQVRQVITSSTILPASPTPVSSISTSSLASAISSSTDPAASPSAGSTDNKDGGSGGGSSSSPLLFFVALGFGVVFTNLW